MLDQRAFGVAMGATYAVFMLALAWVAGLFHVGDQAVAMTASYYPGYRPTFLGGIVGAAYGFVTGYVLGSAISWVYNRVTGARAGLLIGGRM